MQSECVVPAAAQDNLIWAIPSIVERLDLATLFPRQQPLEVELGSGDGSFLVEYARSHPERNFIGVERLMGRLRKLDRKGRRAGLANLRGIRIESAYFLQYLLPPQSVSAVHLYFPDPWPKRKHHKNRLVNPQFTGIAARALSPDGVVYLRTDDADYFQQMTESFAASSAFQPVPTPESLKHLPTDFEREFLARGIQTRHAAYARIF